MACDVLRSITNEERSGIRNIETGSHPTHRNLRMPRLDKSLQISPSILVSEESNKRRMHQPWHNDIYSYSLVRIYNCSGLRKLNHSRLGRSICNLRLSNVPQSRNRRHINHHTRALLLHNREHIVAAQIHRLEVNIDLRVPNGLIHVSGAALLRQADIVDEHIDAAMGAQHVRDQRLDVRRARHVRGHDVAAARPELAPQPVARRLRRRQPQVAAEDYRAARAQHARRGRAVAPHVGVARLADAGEEDDFAAQRGVRCAAGV